MTVGPVSQESNDRAGAGAGAGTNMLRSVSPRVHARAPTSVAIGFRFAVCTRLST